MVKVQYVPPSISKLEALSSSKNVTRSDKATCFIVPASLQINLSAAAKVVEVAEVVEVIEVVIEEDLSEEEVAEVIEEYVEELETEEVIEVLEEVNDVGVQNLEDVSEEVQEVIQAVVEEAIEEMNTLLKELVDNEGDKESLAVSGDHSYMEAPIYNTLGYLNYYIGEKTKSKEYFEKYIETYPNGHNPYDSMGEFYFNEGDMKNAKSFYLKA